MSEPRAVATGSIGSYPIGPLDNLSQRRAAPLRLATIFRTSSARTHRLSLTQTFRIGTARECVN